MLWRRNIVGLLQRSPNLSIARTKDNEKSSWRAQIPTSRHLKRTELAFMEGVERIDSITLS